VQLESRNAKGSVAWAIVADHLKTGGERAQYKELAKAPASPDGAYRNRRGCDQALGPRVRGLRLLRTGGPAGGAGRIHLQGPATIYLIQINDDDVPQLRLKLAIPEDGSTAIRNRIKKSATTSRNVTRSAIQLMKNIEQRKQTILKVCQSIVRAADGISRRGHRLPEANDDQGKSRRKSGCILRR